ncbi:SDR family oxidoreductase [Ramlibacter sp. 2FC]|uniref:SDR family NAD(P)-dependent oxidoreductase n=1 Tax=Ramlibacter sp. 2FC TaxID=2502188 RepID=UPI0032E3F414
MVLITGGSKGIGFECARAFAREGARVAIAARNPVTLAAAVDSLQSEGIQAHAECVDLRDATSLNAAVGRIEAAVGPIGVLINSAGAARHHTPDSTDSERWLAAMQDKYLPYVHAMDAVVPRMAARGTGAVVNIVGTGGKVASVTHMAGGAANAALMLVSAAFAKAWGPKGVRVNVINPGATETQRLSAQLEVKAAASGKSVGEIRAEAASSIPLGRYGAPRDVAATAVFLASAPASYINGASVAVDGGTTSLP